RAQTPPLPGEPATLNDAALQRLLAPKLGSGGRHELDQVRTTTPPPPLRVPGAHAMLTLRTLTARDRARRAPQHPIPAVQHQHRSTELRPDPLHQLLQQPRRTPHRHPTRPTNRSGTGSDGRPRRACAGTGLPGRTPARLGDTITISGKPISGHG